ncbi:MAG: HD-GYP domain-containing protein [Lautropia sp.]|nr:HD-GYP domain-containing protein [Lautropia sp.]
MTANRRYRIAVQDLRMNMFVVELDRPWLDTPFLLQGFLIDDQVELDTLARYCRYVYVDLELSAPSVAMAIRMADASFEQQLKQTPPAPGPGAPLAHGQRQAASARAAPTVNHTVIRAADTPAADDSPPTQPLTPAQRLARSGRSTPARQSPAPSEEPQTIIMSGSPSGASRRYKPRSDVKVSRETRNRFRQLVKQTANNRGDNEQGMLERMLFWLTDHLAQNREIEAHKRTVKQIPELRHAGIKLTRHENKWPMEQELPRAREAFKGGESALDSLIDDIRHGKTPELDAVSGAVDSIVDSMLDNPDAMMWIARLREEDIQVYHHGVRVSLYLVAFGRHLGFPRQELSYLGQIGMLADVGKTKIPRALLEKPGLLSSSEFNLVKEHVNLSLHILNSGPALPAPVLQGISQHHERIDGSGYPNRLKGNQISIYGKMAAIADSFTALITTRPYANASAPQDALMNLYEWSGTSFHEPLVEQFVQAIGVFPVGSLVELSTGEVAVVMAHNRIRRLEPRVLVLSAPDKSRLETPTERDLYQESQQSRGRNQKPLRIVRGLAAGTYGFRLQDYYLDEGTPQHGNLA